MNSRIQIGVTGIITEGDDAGWEVRIEKETVEGNSFLVLISKNFEEKDTEGYDDWVENYESLEKYMEESQWVIDWTRKAHIQSELDNA